jgi:hypothetical protein
VAHAEVYLFAEDHKHEDLKQFARQKLILLLSRADCTDGTVCDAAREAYELLEIYDNNSTSEPACDSMKEVLVHFAALNLEHFSIEAQDRDGELWVKAMEKIAQWRDSEKLLRRNGERSEGENEELKEEIASLKAQKATGDSEPASKKRKC